MSQCILAEPTAKTGFKWIRLPSVPLLLAAAGLALIAAHLPLLLLHGRVLWSKEHYQFFPFMLPAALVLAYRRMSGLGPLTAGSHYVSLGLFGVAWVVLLWAALVVSPWLGAIAALLSLLATAYLFGGKAIVRRLLPVWLFLWLAIPLPGPLDGRLIASLQRLTTRGASDVLDVLGIMHARDGNVLEIGARRVGVDEACSGVHSLFSILPCTAFWLAWKRRPFIHAILLLLAATAWVMAANTARIVAVAAREKVLGVELGAGWGPELVGFVLFACVIGLLWSTDQLLRLLTPLAKLPWLWVLMESSLKKALPRRRNRPGPAPAAAEPTQLPALTATGWIAWPVLSCFGLVAAAQASAIVAQIVAEPHLSTLVSTELPGSMLQALEALDESSLPMQVGNWRRLQFEAKDQIADNRFGRFSRNWVYAAATGGRLAYAGFHYPFVAWKEVPDCYAALGWTVSDRESHPGNETGDFGPFVSCRLQQAKDPNYAYLLFQMCNGVGRPIAPVDLVSWSRIKDRFGTFRQWTTNAGATAALSTMPTIQAQLLVESSAEFGLADEQEARELFRELLKILPR